MEVYKVIIVLKFKGKGCIRYTSDNNTLFLECSGNKFLLMEYHPGIFINKWTCCDGREKTAQGCQKSFAASEKDGYQGKSKHFIHYYELLEFTKNVPKVASIRLVWLMESEARFDAPDIKGQEFCDNNIIISSDWVWNPVLVLKLILIVKS